MLQARFSVTPNRYVAHLEPVAEQKRDEVDDRTFDDGQPVGHLVGQVVPAVVGPAPSKVQVKGPIRTVTVDDDVVTSGPTRIDNRKVYRSAVLHVLLHTRIEIGVVFVEKLEAVVSETIVCLHGLSHSESPRPRRGVDLMRGHAAGEDKRGSAGCIRLANWDAIRLPEIIRPGATVEIR